MPPHPASSVSLCISGFGGARSISTVLRDWIGFFGARPGEVIYVDGGSDRRTRAALVELVRERLIERLELIAPDHWENSFDRCYIQEYRSGWHASLPYVCFVKPDTLPYRAPGTHDGWLTKDLEALDRPGVFAVTNAHLMEPPIAREDEYLVSDFASLNFALMKRDAWNEALTTQIGDFLRGGFKGQYPAHIECEPRYRRALVEWAWQAHCRARSLRTLARSESIDWTIFHVNKLDAKLLSLRARYLRREGVEQFFDKPKAYYRPPPGPLSRLGRSIENAFRRVKRSPRPAVQ